MRTKWRTKDIYRFEMDASNGSNGSAATGFAGDE
jgi:hypothetical protein